MDDDYFEISERDTIVPNISEINGYTEWDKLNYLLYHYLGHLFHDFGHYFFERYNKTYVWPGGTSQSQVYDDLEANGWKCVRRETEGCLCSQHVHLELRSMLYKLLNKLSSEKPGFTTSVGPFPPCDKKIEDGTFPPDAEFGYIRFGEVPECGYSINYIFDEPEAGVSCFEAEIMPNGDFYIVRLTPQLCNEAHFYLSDPSRPIYRLYGEQVGYGWAGEPVLKVHRTEKMLGKCCGVCI